MCTDMVDSFVVTAMVLALDRYGWTAFTAVVRKQVLQIVDTMTGEFTIVDILKMCLSRAIHQLLQKVCSLYCNAMVNV